MSFVHLAHFFSDILADKYKSEVDHMTLDATKKKRNQERLQSLLSDFFSLRRGLVVEYAESFFGHGGR